MAAKKAKKGRKPKPEQAITAAAVSLEKLHDILEAGELKIDKQKLRRFMETKLKGIKSPKVRFVARNAPFMRQPPVPQV